MTSLLIDDVLAIDAGSLTSSLSFEEQEKLEAVLLTHCHYDHIRDIAAIAINYSHFQKRLGIYALSGTLDVIATYILNGIIYPKFNEMPTPDHPPVLFRPLQAHNVIDVAGYSVLAVPVQHGISTVGYQISSRKKSLFYSGDTGPGLSSCWQYISPQLLFTDMTMPDRLKEHALSSAHLTPSLLAEELRGIKAISGDLPRVVLIHISPIFEDEIKEEIEAVARDLKADITLGYEDMVLYL